MTENWNANGRYEKITALIRVAKYRPKVTVGLVCFGGLVAFLEGVGLSFMYPIIQIAQTGGETGGGGPVFGTFVRAYQAVSIPFTIEYLLIGIGVVMTVRFVSSFLADWLRSVLRQRYEEYLRTQAFEATLNAKVGYFDEEGSDDVLNAIITETRYSGRVIKGAIVSMESVFLASVYLLVMFYINPLMTVFALGLLGGITLLVRYVVEPAYTVGTRVALANERVQQVVQSGVQGIRDVKLFTLSADILERFNDAIRTYTQSSITMDRNQVAIQNFYDLTTAMSLFVLIYIGFEIIGLTLETLGIFLFAMFRLSPLMSRLNSQVYNLEGDLSHLMRTQKFIDTIEQSTESGGERPLTEIEHIEFDNVCFAYNDEESVFSGLSFEVRAGDFVAFVGPSGTGKSTIVLLLARMYDPDEGVIRINGVPIEEYDLDELRESVAIVRQQPYIFNETLEYNIRVGNWDASSDDIERACALARVDEFVDELPNGYDSTLGDEGVRLSGGQRQRVAIARALLKDTDLLVLDEATSDLDTTLEREVQAAIESIDQEYTIIAIAHRLSTIQNADCIYTIEDGNVVESGSHDELIEADSEYAELYEAQSKLS